MTGENCRQFRLQFPLIFISRAVYPLGEEGRGVEEIVNLVRYRVHFIIEHEIKIWCKIQVIINSLLLCRKAILSKIRAKRLYNQV